MKNLIKKLLSFISPGIIYSLKPDEFYCQNCRKVVVTTDHDAWLELSGNLKKNQFQIDVFGVCDECLENVHKVVPASQIDLLKHHLDLIGLDDIRTAMNEGIV